MNYNIKIEAFCEVNGLGELKQMQLLPTGVANRTYIVETTVGKYVIKAVNPTRLETETDIKRLEMTEQVAEVAKQNGLASISARRINGKIVNVLEGQAYIVFDFFEGHVIPFRKITTQNCFKIGKVLADLHHMKIDESLKLDFENTLKQHGYGGQIKFKIHWNYYFKKIAKTNPKWLGIFEKNLSDLYEITEATFPYYLTFLPQEIVVAHSDMFSHNVLWAEDSPHIIDWERSSFIDATYDCLHTAVRWATHFNEESMSATIDMQRLTAFFEGYTTKKTINVHNLEFCMHVILYNRLTFLRRTLLKYLEADDQITKEQAEKVIRYSLAIFGGYKGLLIELEELKTHIINRESNDLHEKTRSYELIPKIQKVLEDHHVKVDELTLQSNELAMKYHLEKEKVIALEKQYDAQKSELNKLKSDFNHVYKRAIGLRVIRKLKRILKR